MPHATECVHCFAHIRGVKVSRFTPHRVISHAQLLPTHVCMPCVSCRKAVTVDSLTMPMRELRILDISIDNLVCVTAACAKFYCIWSYQG